MTTLNVNTIEPAGNTLTIGASGDSVVLADDVKANTYKDAGGNTLFVSDGSGNLSSVNSGFGDSLKLLTTSTFTNQATVSFTSGITSTYKEYIFKFINLNPVTDSAKFLFQANATDSTSYDETITSTTFETYHAENNSVTNLLNLNAGQAQGTDFHKLVETIGNAADESAAGELHLFNPASTTYVKHFYSTMNWYHGVSPNHTVCRFSAGYFNTTTAIDDIQFKMNTGNFDGKIKMYGVL